MSYLLAPGTGVDDASRDEFVRGTITSWNVTAQKLFPHSFSVTGRVCRQPPEDLTQTGNLNYGQIGGGAASQPFNQAGLVNGLRTTSAMNVFMPRGKLTYDSLQLSVTRRMINGFQFTSAYTFSKSIDWWAGGIAIPEFWRPNKAVQGGGFSRRVGTSSPHKVDGSPSTSCRSARAGDSSTTAGCSPASSAGGS